MIWAVLGPSMYVYCTSVFRVVVNQAHGLQGVIQLFLSQITPGDDPAFVIEQ
jgi:hypothetical protein